MLNVARLLRCSAVGGVSALDDAFSQVESVWNVRFHGKPTTAELRFHQEPKQAEPMFHVLSLDGRTVANPSMDPQIDKETAIHSMTTMVRQNAMDKILLEAQRQGRISFYMTCFGEEAAVTAAAAAMRPDDEVFMQYREAPIVTYRGYTMQQIIAQCMGNIENDLKGRQMPMHYGSPELHIQMASSPLATQIPQASGLGYALRLENASKENEEEKRVCTCFFGEGAASEGDFHAGLNFASTVGSHTLFFVRNNGYAISTPASAQYGGDGIHARGLAYGIPCTRVDGHDFLAVYKAVKEARNLILAHNKPVLVEAMTYRVSHHSTSDDSTAYRSKDEIAHFMETFSPIKRFENYLVTKGWWEEGQTDALAKETRREVLGELKRQEKLPPWPVETMMDDTFEQMTPELQRQKTELLTHYAKYKKVYDNEKL